jgi:hypothetical protein
MGFWVYGCLRVFFTGVLLVFYGYFTGMSFGGDTGNLEGTAAGLNGFCEITRLRVVQV